jgi:serine/threonine-protein kinase
LASEIVRINSTTPDVVHKELGVNQVITGSVTLDGSATSLHLALYAYPGAKLLGEALLRFSEDEFFSGRQKVFQHAGDLLGWTLPKQAQPIHTGIPEAYGAYLRGRGYLYRSENHENVDKAIAAFHEALNIDSDYHPAKTGLADAYFLKWTLTDDQKWLDTAHATVLQVIEAEPDNAGARITLGNVFIHQSRAIKARSAYAFALELEPANARAGYGLANAYYHLQRFQDAEKQFISVLERYPNDWTGHRRLGTYYFRSGLYQKAAASFERLIELAPRNNSGYFNLSGALLAQGKLEEALEVSRRSIEVEPTAWANSNMGTALYYLGRYEEAAEAFENAAERRPSHYLTWGNLADAYRWAPGLRDKAAPTYRHALELLRKELETSPDDPYHQSSRLLYLAKSDQLADARSILLRASKPWDVQLIFERAQIHELLGDRKQALTYIEAAINGGFGLVNIMNEPELSALREDPRFHQILERTQPL